MVENPPFVKQILNRHGKVSSAELSWNLSNPGRFLQLSGTAQPWRNAGTKGTAGTLHVALICGFSEYAHLKHQRKKVICVSLPKTSTTFSCWASLLLLPSHSGSALENSNHHTAASQVFTYSSLVHNTMLNSIHQPLPDNCLTMSQEAPFPSKAPSFERHPADMVLAGHGLLTSCSVH